MFHPVFSVLVESFDTEGGESSWEGKSLKTYFLLVRRLENVVGQYDI